MNLVIDLESTPTQNPKVREAIEKSITPPGNYKKAESIEKWEAENKPALVKEKLQKTALDGTFGQIAAIGYQWALDHGDNEPQCFVRETTERDLLVEFFQWLPREPSVWIGHNICEFDLRFLWQRCVINDLPEYARMIPYDARPWSDRVLDTMHEWAGTRGSIKLEDLALALGVNDPLPLEFDVTQIQALLDEGDVGSVRDYCLQDVRLTMGVYRKLRSAA